MPGDQTLVNIFYVSLILLTLLFIFLVGLAVFAVYRLIKILRRVQRGVENAGIWAKNVVLMKEQARLGGLNILDMILRTIFRK